MIRSSKMKASRCKMWGCCTRVAGLSYAMRNQKQLLGSASLSAFGVRLPVGFIAKCSVQRRAAPARNAENAGLSPGQVRTAPPPPVSGRSSPGRWHELTPSDSAVAMSSWGVLRQESVQVPSGYITSYEEKRSCFSPGLHCRSCQIIFCDSNCCREKHAESSHDSYPLSFWAIVTLKTARLQCCTPWF